MIVFLVGYMGCGKTTLGRRLARALRYGFVDTDERIERREGADVCDIFRYAGEEYFRRAERTLLEELIASDENTVVSTGGGLPVWKDNMERMNEAGLTIYLRRAPQQIAARLSAYGRWKRPKLRGLSDEELVAFMQRNMSEREPFYSRARIAIDCGALSDDEILECAVAKVRGYHG